MARAGIVLWPIVALLIQVKGWNVARGSFSVAGFLRAAVGLLQRRSPTWSEDHNDLAYEHYLLRGSRSGMLWVDYREPL